MWRHRRKSFFSLNITVLGLLTGVLINAFAGMALWQNWVNTHERVAQRTASLAQAYADFTFRALETYDQVLQDVQGLVESSMPVVELQPYLDRQKRQHPYLLNLFSFDPAGRIIAGTQDRQADLSTRDYFTIHRDNEDSGRFIGHPTTSRITPGRWFFPMSRRIPGIGGPFLGVAAATIDIADLVEAFDRLREGPDVAIALVHNDGTVFVRSPLVQEMLGQTIRVNGLQGLRYRTFETLSPFDNTTRIVTQRQVPHYPLMIYASLPQRLVGEEWSRTALPIASVAIVMTLAVLALTFHLQRQSYSRERLLQELAQAKDQAEQALSTLARAQTAMVRSEKMAALGGLVAGIAHEVNTPVGNALTSASYLDKENQDLRRAYEQQTLSAADMEAYLDSSGEAVRLILSNCDRAAELIHGFKQVAVDQTSGERREYELAEYVAEILLSLRPKLKHTRHTVEVQVPQGIMLNGYPGALSQILTNLVLNSLLHGFDEDQAGTITIAARAEQADLELIYSDNGKGIPAELHDRVFEPFFTTRRGSGGSGLGMNIIYNIVHRTLHGTITLDSQSGQGVHFTIRFPLIAPRSAAANVVEGSES